MVSPSLARQACVGSPLRIGVRGVLAAASLANGEVAARASQRRSQLDQRTAAHRAARRARRCRCIPRLFCCRPFRRQLHRLVLRPGVPTAIVHVLVYRLIVLPRPINVSRWRVLSASAVC